MRLKRSSGVLLHISSLPSRGGIGDFGPEAVRFLDFLSAAGQSIWQILPLNVLGAGDNPYNGGSALAGNELLISLKKLVERGYLRSEELTAGEPAAANHVDFEAVKTYKLPLLHQAAERFFAEAMQEERAALERFAKSQDWLAEYALFEALDAAHGGVCWNRWPVDLARRRPAALKRARAEHAARIQRTMFLQFEFARQWRELRDEAATRGIAIVGDLPIYVSMHSADVWCAPRWFRLDRALRPTVVSGSPPDDFAPAGQMWGNPLYRWEAHAEDGYGWWVRRLRHVLNLFDIVRVDHFRAFAAAWEIPAGKPASAGRWAKGPGAAMFKAARRALGELPVIAEDLGHITPDVHRLRRELRMPGMAILQFGLGRRGYAGYRPHLLPEQVAAYTGTHDNQTFAGWWHDLVQSALHDEAAAEETEFIRRYLHADEGEIHWAAIRSLMASAAAWVITPMQDVLGLGDAMRMNIPGTPTGNWRWRMRGEAISDEVIEKLREMTELFDRAVKRPT